MHYTLVTYFFYRYNHDLTNHAVEHHYNTLMFSFIYYYRNNFYVLSFECRHQDANVDQVINDSPIFHLEIFFDLVNFYRFNDFLILMAVTFT